MTTIVKLELTLDEASALLNRAVRGSTEVYEDYDLYVRTVEVGRTAMRKLGRAILNSEEE